MKINCSFCGVKYNEKPSHINKTKNPCCSRYCSSNLKKTTYLSESNPNKKYFYNESFFQNIDTEFKAWMLGWIASDGSIQDSGITLCIHKNDISILEMIKREFCPEIPIKTVRKKLCSLTINSKKIVNDVCQHLKIVPGTKAFSVRFPESLNENLKWAFLRGYFEGDGNIRKPDKDHHAPECSIVSSCDKMLEDIQRFTEIPCKINYDNNVISWYGVNALDFLGKIYESSQYRLKRKYKLYISWSQWQPTISKNWVGRICFCKTDENAVIPSKKNVSDSGYDLTLIKKVKTDGLVDFYDTGIKVIPPYGYYFDLVPRSSIAKTGYMLANSVGIIDRSYIGNILVPLMKVDKSKSDLELPMRVVQLIPRKIEHFEVEEVDELPETKRGASGWGSTGSK
jgi:deoxyuridine 5'-triphosphate nucleotidohydrolase